VGRLNRDTLIALVLLVFCGVMFSASLEIEVTDYGTLPSSVWPQAVLVVLTVFSLGLLGQSVVQPRTDKAPADDAPRGIGRFGNALIVYVLFFLFLLTLDLLGMLLGGIAFVFLALTLLGEPRLQRVPLHLLISVATVGIMWSIFTFGLGVLLPDGELLQLN